MFKAQRHVILKPIVPSCPKSNSSAILCLPSLPSSLKEIQSKMNALYCPQHFTGAQGRVTSKLIYGCVSIWMVICKFDDDPIKKGAIMSWTFLSGAQGHIAPKLTDGCGPNSYLSEILWLSSVSWFHISLTMILSKRKALSCPQYFLHYKFIGTIFDAQVHVTETKRSIWSEIEFAQDFTLLRS